MTFSRTGLTTLALALLTTPLLEATSAHTWVSGTGSDLNTGTRTSPLATFTAAISATTAGGVISVLDPGDYGPVTITKAITIDGGRSGATITFNGAEGVFVNAGASDTVILRHLTIDGMGLGQDGVFLMSARNLIIEDCSVENAVSLGLGIGSGSAQNVVVKNTAILGGQLGLRVFQGVGPVQISMRGVTISGATSAAVFVRSGLTEISDSLITQSAIGFEDDTSAVINVANSVISYNGTDALAYSPSTVLMSDNNTFFANNGTGAGSGASLAVPQAPISPFRALPSLPDDKPRGNVSHQAGPASAWR